jgi:hypothetical protein
MFGFSGRESVGTVASKTNYMAEGSKTMSERDEIEQTTLDRYGIERVPAHVFLWGGYRYSNARDALAAAKRGAKA